jgi:hypothetical protein
MFTNEFKLDATVTTVLDETAELPDVELIIDDEKVWIRQFNMEEQGLGADLICMTPKMFNDMLEAMNHPEGMYITKYKGYETS